MSDRHSWPSTAHMGMRQIRHQLNMFVRVPIAVFFTVALPIVVMLIFNAVFADGDILTNAGPWPVREFYSAAIAAFTAVSATFTNLANMVPIRREEGVLQRWRVTPIPLGVLVVGYVGSAMVIAFVCTSIVVVIGWLAYGLTLSVAGAVSAALTMMVATVSFAAMGMALAALVPTASTASAAANAIILPLAMVSNVFIPVEQPPKWLDVSANVLPLKPFITAFQSAFHPTTTSVSFDVRALLTIAAWGALATVVAVTRFRWNVPPGGATRRRR